MRLSRSHQPTWYVNFTWTDDPCNWRRCCPGGEAPCVLAGAGARRASLDTSKQRLRRTLEWGGKGPGEAFLLVSSMKWHAIRVSKKGVLYTQIGGILWGKHPDENVKDVVGKATLTHPQGAHVEAPSDCLVLQDPGCNQATPVNHYNHENLIRCISWHSEFASVMSFVSMESEGEAFGGGTFYF